jgi:hypothetical protein
MYDLQSTVVLSTAAVGNARAKMAAPKKSSWVQGFAAIARLRMTATCHLLKLLRRVLVVMGAVSDACLVNWIWRGSRRRVPPFLPRHRNRTLVVAAVGTGVSTYVGTSVGMQVARPSRYGLVVIFPGGGFFFFFFGFFFFPFTPSRRILHIWGKPGEGGDGRPQTSTCMCLWETPGKE